VAAVVLRAGIRDGRVGGHAPDPLRAVDRGWDRWWAPSAAVAGGLAAMFQQCQQTLMPESACMSLESSRHLLVGVFHRLLNRLIRSYSLPYFL
jgi:hypothetical protein